MKTRFLSFLMLLLAAVMPASAYDFMVNGLCYNYNEDGTSVTVTRERTSIPSYSNLNGDLVIPSSVTYNDTTYSVTAIDTRAFYNCSSMTSVTIGDSITSIGELAFIGCTGLTKVEVNDIAAWCNIDFGDNYANPIYYSKNLYLNGTKVTNLSIPNTVTTIKSYAFFRCMSLTSVTIPNSVNEIGYRAFMGCEGLTSATIGSSKIGPYAFENCWLTSVTIGDSVDEIDVFAFSSCTELTRVNISDLASWCNIDFGNVPANPLSYAKNLYLNGTIITKLSIPSTVTNIKNYTFYNWTSLEEVTIPNSVTSIGESSFYECSSLTSVTIPNSVELIGKCAFKNCTKLTSIIIPNSVTTIMDEAFNNCIRLSSVLIPNSVTSIGYFAFYGCSRLLTAVSKINNPQSVNYTSNYIFRVPGNSTLYVPKGTLDSYQLEQYNGNVNPWLMFGNVCEVVDGDVNLDGAVTSADVTVVYNHLLNGDNTYIATSDIDSDGTITAADITAIYNMLLGQ
ncbi:MAG: leucine-rich repeat protein [Muribaculaceae bacterium]|nr:leucine-rich repeat protein [Muribaculaceae bacterium]